MAWMCMRWMVTGKFSNQSPLPARTFGHWHKFTVLRAAQGISKTIGRSINLRSSLFVRRNPPPADFVSGKISFRVAHSVSASNVRSYVHHIVSIMYPRWFRQWIFHPSPRRLRYTIFIVCVVEGVWNSNFTVQQTIFLERCPRSSYSYPKRRCDCL